MLERRNYVRKIVSSLVAQSRHKYRQAAGVHADFTPIHLDPWDIEIDRTHASLIELLDGYAREFNHLRRLLADRPVLYLAYEDDLLKDPSVGYRRSCEYLELEPAQFEVRFGRSNPFPLHSILENFTEVDRVSKGTPYAWMMADEAGY